MNKVKNLLANFPVRIGIVFQSIGNLFFMLGCKLHIKFKTESGLKLQRLEKRAKEVMQELQGHIPPTQPTQTVQAPKQSSKLFNAIKGENNG